jgi:hypothetical protein
MDILQFLEYTEFKIIGGSQESMTTEFYGPDARTVLIDLPYHVDGYHLGAEIECSFDSKTLEIYEVVIYSEKLDGMMLWRFSEEPYSDWRKKVCVKLGIDDSISTDGHQYIDISEGEMLSIIDEIKNNQKNTDETEIELVGLSDDEIYALMRMAHERNMTFNDFANSVISEYISQKMNSLTIEK